MSTGSRPRPYLFFSLTFPPPYNLYTSTFFLSSFLSCSCPLPSSTPFPPLRPSLSGSLLPPASFLIPPLLPPLLFLLLPSPLPAPSLPPLTPPSSLCSLSACAQVSPSLIKPTTSSYSHHNDQTGSFDLINLLLHLSGSFLYVINFRGLPFLMTYS